MEGGTTGVKVGISSTDFAMITQELKFICDHLTRKDAFFRLLVAASLLHEGEEAEWKVDLEYNFDNVFTIIRDKSSMPSLLWVLLKSRNFKVFLRLLWPKMKNSIWEGFNSYVRNVRVYVLDLPVLVSVVVVSYFEILDALSPDDWKEYKVMINVLVWIRDLVLAPVIGYWAVSLYTFFKSMTQINKIESVGAQIIT